MDLGLGILFGTLFVSVAAVIVTVVKMKGSTTDVHTITDMPSQPDRRAYPQSLCTEHSGIQAKLDALMSGQARIEGVISKVFDKIDGGKT